MRCSRKRSFVLGPLAGLTALAVACLGSEAEPVDYLHRPDAVIIQMLNVSDAGQPGIAARLTLPAVTLYGDGSLLFTERSGGDGARLVRADLPPESVQELVEFIVDEEFLEMFEFFDEHPRPSSPDFLTTYLYVNTRGAVNSASAYALDAGPPEEEGDEWDEFRRLQTIKQRLEGIDPEALGGRVLGPYEHNEIALVVQPLQTADPEPPPWPVTGIDLASLAPPGSGVVSETLGLAAVSELIDALPPQSVVRYRQGDRVFAVGYRPALPFEERFPEFDWP